MSTYWSSLLVLLARPLGHAALREFLMGRSAFYHEKSRKVCLLWSRPAVWPRGRTLSSVGGPCLSPSIKLRAGSAIWAALRKLASALSDAARQGVNGFGTFCRIQRSSSVGAKPDTIEHRVDTRVEETSAMGFSPQGVFYWQPPR